jgi:hypothetical protein
MYKLDRRAAELNFAHYINLNKQHIYAFHRHNKWQNYAQIKENSLFTIVKFDIEV